MPLHEGRYRTEGVVGHGGKTSQKGVDDRAFKKAKSNRSSRGNNRRHAQIFAVDNMIDGGAGRRDMEAESSPEIDSDLLTRTSWTNATVALNEIRKVSPIRSYNTAKQSHTGPSCGTKFMYST